MKYRCVRELKPYGKYLKGLYPGFFSPFQCGNGPLTHRGHGMKALEWDLAWCLDSQAAHQIPNLP